MRSNVTRRLVLTLSLLLTLPAASQAQIAIGAAGPAFTKNQLGGGTVSLSQYSGKVVVLFLLGYGCPFCQSSGPSVQADLHAYYQTQRPGEVQVLGADLWNGTASQVNTFKVNTGAQYPLLLNGGIATGGNLSALYGTYDNYIVLDQQGIVRYHAALNYAQGQRYQLSQIRAIVDGLLGPPLDVPGGTRNTLALAVSPHPARGPVEVALALPQGERDVTIEVLDTGGRRVTELYRGSASAGPLRLTWSRSDAQGAAVAAGLYFIRASVGSEVLKQRVVVLR